MIGLDLLGADDVRVIPKVGANYDDDPKTVTAVQYYLKQRGYDLGTTGPNGDGVDGLYGSHTKNAVKKLQASLGYDQTGVIDENIVRYFKVTPGKLPPGVSKAANAAVQAQAALDVATAAEHAETPADTTTAATQLQDVADSAAPPLSPAAQQIVDKAVAAAKAASTPAEVKSAASGLVDAAKAAHEEVKPSWWSLPLWSGFVERWKAATALGIAAVAATGVVLVFKGSSHSR